MSVAHDLAAAIDGTVRADSLIFVQVGEGVHIVDCTINGKVVLTTPTGGPYQLGSISDGVEHLAGMYHAATSEVTC